MKKLISICCFICVLFLSLSYTLSANNKTNAAQDKSKSKSEATENVNAKLPISWILKHKSFEQLSSSAQEAIFELHDIKPNINPNINPIPIGLEESTPNLVDPSKSNLRLNDPAIDVSAFTQSESCAAVNGLNVIVGFNDVGRSEGRSGYAFSTDGGTTFTHKRLPSAPSRLTAGDPCLAFGVNNEIYYSTLVRTPEAPLIIGVAKSTDQGATFSSVVDASTKANNPFDAQDKEWMTVDTQVQSPFRGNVYVSWTTFTPTGSYISFSRSTDGAASFEPPIILSPVDNTFSVQGSMLATNTNGELYLLHLDSHFNINFGITLTKSTDGGKTFSQPISIVNNDLVSSTLTGTNRVRSSPFPYLVIDKKNNLHITYSGKATTLRDREDVYYVRSTDQGLSFSNPKRVNDDNTTTAQSFPSIAITDDGVIGIKWADRRNDPINDSLTDIYMAISKDGGNTFSKNFRITDNNWTYGPIEEMRSAAYHGDYDTMIADNDNFYIPWSDERNSNPDVYFAKVNKDQNPLEPDFNISVTSPAESLIAGDTVSFDFNSQAFNGFSEKLKLTAQPSIEGISYTLSKKAIKANQKARLKILTSSSLAAGTYLITLEAKSSLLSRKTTFRINVLEANHPFTAPLNITNSQGYNLKSKLVVDNKNTMHLIFQDDTQIVGKSDSIVGQTFYQQSTNSGKTFSTPRKISNLDFDSDSPDITTDSKGNIYIVFQTFVDSMRSILFTKSTDGGKTFSEPLAVSKNTQTFVQFPKIAIDPKDNISIIFSERTFNTATDTFDFLFISQSNNQGSSFSAPRLLTTSTFMRVQEATIFFNSERMVYIIFEDINRNTINMISSKDGVSFSTKTLFSDSRFFVFTPHAAIDKKDNIFVAFPINPRQQTSISDILFIKSTDKAMTFSSPIQLSDSMRSSLNPYIIPGNNDSIAVVWRNVGAFVNSNTEIFFAASSNAGKSFGKAVNISKNLSRSANPTGVFNGQGRFAITWSDDLAAKEDIFLTLTK